MSLMLCMKYEKVTHWQNLETGAEVIVVTAFDYVIQRINARKGGGPLKP